MARFRFELGLAGLFVALFAGFWLWQNPGIVEGPLRPDEIDRYMTDLHGLPFPGDKAELEARFRAWMQADDGRAFTMLNLMRYYPTLQRFDGAPPFAGTPQQSNARYEDEVKPLLLKRGGYPAFAGAVPGGNLITFDPTLDNWSRVLVVRYPSRRRFMELVTDPAYGPIEPYKLMALSVVLTPMTPEIVLPELHQALGAGLLILFLGIGWWRASRRRPIAG